MGSAHGDRGYGRRLRRAREAAGGGAGDWPALRRLLMDVADDVWRTAARGVARLLVDDPETRAPRVWVESGLVDPRWRDRAVAVVVELSALAPEHTVRVAGGPVPARELVHALLLGERGPEGSAAVLGALDRHALDERGERALLDWAETGDRLRQRLAIAALGRRAGPRSYERARERFDALLRQRVYTLPDHLERGRALAAASRWLIESARASADPNLARRVAAELHRRYARGNQIVRSALLPELYRWALASERLGIPRGVFDAAGEHAEGETRRDQLLALCEALRGAALARRYWRALGTMGADRDTVAAALADRDFLAPRQLPPADDVEVEDCLAFLDRLVRAEERAYFGVVEFFGDATAYRALDPGDKAGLLLSLEACYRCRMAISPTEMVAALDERWPGRFAALGVRLAACDADRRGALFAHVACLARDSHSPRLMGLTLELLLINRDRMSASRLEASLTIIEPVLHDAAELPEPLRDTLGRIVEAVLDRASRDGERLLRLVLLLLDAGVRPALLADVARRAREPHVGDLLDAVAGLLVTIERVADGPERLGARLADFAYRLPTLLPGESAAREGLAERLRLVRRMLDTPLLGGLDAALGARWERALVLLARQEARDVHEEPAVAPRAVGNLVRDLADEVETYSTIDFGAVRERRAALARVEERVDALPAAFGGLPPLERRALERVASRWKTEIDRAERFLLKQRTSLFAGEPAEALGLEPGTGDDGPAAPAVARVREALHRFRIGFLVGRFDLDRAFALLRHGPDADEARITGDRLHGRALAVVSALMFLPYLLYPLLPRELAGEIHLGAASAGLIGGALLMLWAGKRDPWLLLPLLLPRLMGAILTWYFVLTLGEELWTFTASVGAGRFELLVIPTASCCLLYTLAEVTRHGDSRSRAWYKALVAYAVGLTQSFAIGAFLTGVLGPAILADHLVKLSTHTVLGIPVYIRPFDIPFFPSIVLMWSFLVLFLAMFLNLLFEDKGMIDI